MASSQQKANYKRWYKKNRKKRDKYCSNWYKEHAAILKKKVYTTYGNFCACCGETETGFLTIDHIGGGGREHRKALGGGAYSYRLYKAIIDEKFPKDRYRILCMNCNWATRRGNPCPHNLKERGELQLP